MTSLAIPFPAASLRQIPMLSPAEVDAVVLDHIELGIITDCCLRLPEHRPVGVTEADIQRSLTRLQTCGAIRKDNGCYHVVAA